MYADYIIIGPVVELLRPVLPVLWLIQTQIIQKASLHNDGVHLFTIVLNIG